MLMEKKPEIGSKYQIVRAFNGHELRSRVDSNKIKSGILESLRSTRSAPLPKAGR